MEQLTLAEILAARDRRAARQAELLGRFGRPLICVTMNIAGPVKYTPLIGQGFALSLARLEQQLTRLSRPVLFREHRTAATGCEAFFVVDAPAHQLKAMTTDLEEADQLGRLLDLDVLDESGKKLERQTQRGCLICGAPGRACARSRAHCVEALQGRTTEILTEALARHGRDRASELACRALLFEAAAAPKPGLVDRYNTGSHRDMDLFSFLSSAAALTPYFSRCVAIGQATAHLPPEETFRQLRRPGRLAEGDMVRATGGVNTHKGAIFLMGVLCGALGRLDLARWGQPTELLDLCAAMTRGLTAREPQSPAPETAGERFFAQLGIRGIRGEVEQGFPTVRSLGLPALEAALSAGRSLEDAGCQALLAMMTACEDTALLHRGGTDGWQWTMAQAAALREKGADRAELQRLDREMTEKNLSPGGSADLLAVCYLLHFLRQEALPQY